MQQTITTIFRSLTIGLHCWSNFSVFKESLKPCMFEKKTILYQRFLLRHKYKKPSNAIHTSLTCCSSKSYSYFSPKMIENTKHSVSSATNIYIHTKITATPIKDNKQKRIQLESRQFCTTALPTARHNTQCDGSIQEIEKNQWQMKKELEPTHP